MDIAQKNIFLLILFSLFIFAMYFVAVIRVDVSKIIEVVHAEE